MRFSSATFHCGAGPLAALTLFAVFSAPVSTSPVQPKAMRQVAVAHLDIKPGSCPNPINVNHAADDDMMLFDGAMVSVLPMSILGNKFDVEQVDLGSVGLSRVGGNDLVVVRPVRIEYADTGTPFEGEGCDCHALAGDGVIDIDFKFSKQEVIDAFGLEDEADGTFVQLQISGTMKGELEFVGRDCVRVVNH